MMPRLAVMPVEHLADLLDQVVARQDAIGQVGPIEVADQHDRIAQGELGDDVAADLLGGGGGVGVDGGVGEELAQPAQLAIFGAEIVAPVADAMGLVDGEGADADLLQKRGRSRSAPAVPARRTAGGCCPGAGPSRWRCVRCRDSELSS